MEKIILKPIVKELLHRNAEDGIYFDVLSYQGAGNQERSLGSLFIIGQIKYSEDDLSYMIGLASSLAKREYYSQESVQGQDGKKAFERTLKKLNEVLEDFFLHKNLKLNIGLAAIAGNDIYISRLGKLKLALARDDKYIDILNNVEFFNKDTEDSKRFSNIISGKLHPRDKIFAYFPTRAIVAREKQLNELFVKENQDVFGQKIAHLAANTTSFSCCGVHIDMRETKEIPVEAYATEVWKSQGTKKKPPEIVTAKTRTTEIQDEEEDGEEPLIEPAQSDTMPQESPRIIPAEFNITKRATLFTPMFKQFSKFKNLGRLSFRARSRGFSLIAAIVIIPLIAIVLFRSVGPSNKVKDARAKAKENIKLAQSRLSQSNIKETRSLLQAALISVAGITDKKTEKLRSEINQTLGGINHVSDKRPQLYFDPALNNKDFKASLIAADNDLVIAANESGSLFSLTQNDISELAQLKTTPGFLFNSKTLISIFNGSDNFGVYNAETKKSELYSLKKAPPTADAMVYEGNFYLLANNSIYKYADAVTGGTKQTVWSSDSASGTLISITADGNIYALNTDGKLIKYFKGKKDGELDLQVAPSSGSRIFTFSAKGGSASGGKDSAFLYLTDKINGWVYVFDKANGELKVAYDLSAVYGEPVESADSISDISISPDGSVWILSADNKIWNIKP